MSLSDLRIQQAKITYPVIFLCCLGVAPLRMLAYDLHVAKVMPTLMQSWWQMRFGMPLARSMGPERSEMYGHVTLWI